MKISNETKIGVLAVVGIGLLILGFNFLKGKNLFKKERKIFAVFEEVQGLTESNPVMINGLQIGSISKVDGGKDMRRIVVTVRLTQDVNIPDNSVAMLKPNPLGATTLEVKLGTTAKFLNPGDTLVTTMSGGAFDEALKMLNPVLYEVRNAVKSLDSVLHIIGTTFDPATKNNIKGVVENLNATTASFTLSAQSLQTILNPKTGALAKSLANIETFTKNLNSNNDKLNNIMSNADKASGEFAKLDIQKTITLLDNTIKDLQAGIAKINNNKGTLGLLMNDSKMYDNLASSTKSLNTLLDDIRIHPKRYISISVFGKKDKGNFLTTPITTDTTKVPLKAK